MRGFVKQQDFVNSDYFSGPAAKRARYNPPAEMSRRGSGSMESMAQFRGKKTFEKTFRKRKGKTTTLKQSMIYAYKGLHPRYTLETYTVGTQDSVGSAVQHIMCNNIAAGLPNFEGNIGAMLSNQWLRQVWEKYVKDVMNNTFGVPNSAVPSTQFMQPLAIPFCRRKYTFMNTGTAHIFLEFVEYVFKPSQNLMLLGGTEAGVDSTPVECWNVDIDNFPLAANTVAPQQVTVPTINDIGRRPDYKCKALNSKWKKERSTKFVLAPGTTINHTITLPPMVVTAEQVGGFFAEVNQTQSYIPNVTRFFMAFMHCQLGFDSSVASATRLETVGGTLQHRYTQTTSIKTQISRPQIQVQRSPHDLANVAQSEHVALATPALIWREPPAVANVIVDVDV